MSSSAHSSSHGPHDGSLPHRHTFLVPNIHCSSCSNTITTLLFTLDPPPKSVDVSIANHTVRIEHDAATSLTVLSETLNSAGFEVQGIAVDGALHDVDGPTPVPTPDAPWSSWIGRIVGGWGTVVSDQEIQRRHRENCEQCRREEDGNADTASKSGHIAARVSDDAPLNTVLVDSSLASPKLYRASLSIGGMSCSSCVGKITNALQNQAWVTSASVSLLTRIATVEFVGEDHSQDLVPVVRALGYDATIEEVEDVPDQAEKNEAAQDLWQAAFSVTGMTCSSCVGSVSGALEKLPWMRSVNVSLVTSSATATFEGKEHLPEIISTVGSLGYIAVLSDLTVAGKSTRKDSRRTLLVHVGGMYCQHCPDRVTAALRQEFDDRVRIEKPPTLDRPVMTVSYQPEPPSFTVRAILTTISGADPAFAPVIHHPPTVEERAGQILRQHRRQILYRVLLSFIVAIPTLIIGVVYMNLVPPDDPGRRYLMEPLSGVPRAEWALLVMATPVYFFGADVFHRRTIKELYALWRPGSPVPLLRRFYRFGSMDMLVSFATTIAFVSSIVEMIIAATSPSDHHMEGASSHMDAVIFLTLFLLAGRMIEAYSKAKTGEAVTKLGSLRPKEAILIIPGDSDGMQEGGAGRSQPISVDLLDTGDLARIVHGGSPPWDGILVDGEADFMESSLTGESKPVKKGLGDPIYSGTVNKGGPVTIRITGASGNSLLDQIIKVVREGQARRAPIERVADTITGYFVPIVTLIAIVTWLTWLGLGVGGQLPEDYRDVNVGGWPFWSIQFAIAVFVIACPCGIGLAAPTALFVGGGLAAKHGILAKGGGEAFQEASHLDIIVFDKTGTLTEGGEPTLTDHLFLAAARRKPWTENTILSCLGGLEGNSSHPIAKAVVTFCSSKTSTNSKPEKVKEIPGKGIRGSLAEPTLGRQLEMIVGNEALMTDHGVAFDRAALDELDVWKGQAKSVVLIAGRLEDEAAWTPLLILAVSDALRSEARPVLEELQRQGIESWMISGDNEKTAQAVGAMVGIPADRIIAGVLPEEKAAKIQYLQRSQVRGSRSLLGRSQQTRRPTVAMVGDGVNDSPALTVADVGIAIGSGSDVAISAAEFVLVKSNLTTLLTLCSLSRAVFRRVKFNFAWALVYNMLALPVAAGVLYPVRTNGGYTRLDPVWASLAMALSSLSVITSSLLLRTRLPLIGYRSKTMKDLT
jgi:P-type Cu+ transporter